MWIYILLPCFALAGFFTDHKEKNLNHSVSPCDNFYRHVCRENFPRDDTLIARLQADLAQKIQEYLPADYKTFADALKNAYSYQANANFEQEKLATQQNTKTGRMETESHLPDEVTMENYLHHACYINKISSVCSFQRMGQFLLGNNFLYKTAAYEAFRKFLHENPSFLDTEQRIFPFFELSKKRILQLFKQTPWMDQYVGSDKSIIGRLEKTVFQKLNKTMVDFGPFYRKGLQILERCLFEKGKRDVLYCSGYALVATIAGVSFVTGEGEYSEWIYYPITSFNAGYGGAFSNAPFVVLNPVLYGCIYDNWISTLGSLNYGVAHELAHSGFSKKYSRTVPSSSKCFQDHMEGVCNRFHKQEICPKGSQTYGEDGADFVSIKVNLDILEVVHLIDKKKDFQDFFYAAAITWCGNDKVGAGDPHSSGYVRVNGIMRQFPQFAEAFECKPGDYMVQNEDEKCALVGESAPPTH